MSWAYPVKDCEQAIDLAWQEALPMGEFSRKSGISVDRLALMIAWDELAIEVVEFEDDAMPMAVIVPGGKHDIPFDGRP